ncbi:MAG TPA: endonuclease MutS2 [Bacillota bacterium]|nr:endonuclease MutS2 [Bacillota bacterium]
MNEHTYRTLEYEKIKTELLTYAVSGLGRRLIEALQPSINENTVRQRLQETTETRRILDVAGSIPLHGLSDIRETLERVGVGAVLDGNTLLTLADFLRGCRRLKQFMVRFRETAPMVAGYAGSLTAYEEVEELIELSIENGRVSNAASQRLAKIRKEMEILKARIRERLNAFLTSGKYRECLQENVISLKDGRHCLVVKAASRSQVEGSVIASSGSGQTVFIEPAAIRNLTDQLRILEGQEEAEEYQILAALTGEIYQRLPSVHLNMETMAAYDFACAKAKYARAIDGIPAEISKRREILIRNGRHPLLGKKAVPLNLQIGRGFRTLLITGPNTGGKTVALKTVGLMALMTQSGLHIPADLGTVMNIFDKVLVDIGDQQSIEQSLSTFSGHVGNLIDILNDANSGSLVLIDEIGTGTDPAEGAALGAAVLDDLYALGTLTIATTHYGDLKRYSQNHQGFMNGCMTFNAETLQPLYQLIIGRSGRSNGLWIAERLGMKEKTLAKARAILGEPDAADDSADEIIMPPVPVEPVPEKNVPCMEKDETALENGPVEERPFRLGDSVYVGTIGENAILAELADAHGDVVVLFRGKRLKVNQKRIKLHIPAEELYPDPEHYDLDIVLLSWEDRKLKKAMSKRHVEGKERVIKEER